MDKDWRPIETAPSGEEVLIMVPWEGTNRVDISYKRDGTWFCLRGRGGWFNGQHLPLPTHWMPLPATPDQEERDRAELARLREKYGD